MIKRPLCLGAVCLVAAVRLYLWWAPSPGEAFEPLDGRRVLLAGTVCAKDGASFQLSHISQLSLLDGQGVQIQVQQETVQTQAGSDLRGQSQTIRSQENQLQINQFQTNQLQTGQIELNTINFHVKKVLCRTKQEQPSLGAKVLVWGRLRALQSARTPGTFDERAYYDAKGISFVLQDPSMEQRSGGSFWREGLWQFRQACAALLERSFSPRDASVMKAMLLGEKQEMDQEVKSLYQEGGIAHVLAVSGLHISFLGMTLYGLFKKLRFRTGAACLFSGFVVCGYVCMIGFTPSSERALIMFLFFLGAAAAGRTYDRLTALGAAAVWILAGNPYALLDAGFLLSFCAVLGIELAVPCAAGREETEKIKPPDWKAQKGPDKNAVRQVCARLWEKLKVALLSGAAVSLFTLPAVLWYFYEFPLYAVLLNLLVLPLMGVLLPLGFCVLLLGGIAGKAALLCSLPAHAILSLFEGLCRAGEKLPWLRLTCGRPGGAQTLLFFALLFCMFAAMNYAQLPRLTFWSGFLAAVCILTFRLSQGLSVTMLDVGQGDCFVVTEGNRCFLIDGGSSSQKEVGKYVISPYLKYSGISRVDCAFVSHLDEDHYNGILELLEEGKPRIIRLCLPAAQTEEGMTAEEVQAQPPLVRLEAAAARSGCRVSFLSAGDRLEINSGSCSARAAKDSKLSFLCLHPEKGEVFADRNGTSEVLLLQEGTFRMLFMGDLGEEEERRLLEEGLVPCCQVLKVGHHGSVSSTGENFLSAVCAQIAFVSCGEHNRYGHPSPETMERLEEAGVRSFVTKDCGTVRIDARTCADSGTCAIDAVKTLCHDKNGGGAQ